MALIGEMKYLTIGGKTYQIPVPESGSSVEFTPNLTSGTKVGDLTIDDSTVSLYAPTNTDTKLQIAAVTSGTTYYPVVAANSTTAATRQYDATGLAYAGTNGTTSAVGTAKITLGNSTASGTANNKKGQIILYGSTAYATTIDPGSPTAARTITLPDKAGTVALISDIPTISYPVTSVNTKTGAVSLTASDVGAFEKLPYAIGTTEAGIRPYVDQARANRLAFLPADQIIVEKTIDGGTTWMDAGCSDAQKISLFTENGGGVNIPLLNNAKSTLCGLRFTITGMKYNVPSGTSETSKYNYWNSTYVTSQERYFNVREWWFWLSANNDTIRPEIYCATGADPNTWITIFNTDFGMTGWSGSDWIRSGDGKTFGGGTNQTSNYWNWRIVFWSRIPDGKTAFQSTTVQTIQQIRCYGDLVWGSTDNNLMAKDHLYSWDNYKNATFPAKVTLGTAPIADMDAATKKYVDDHSGDTKNTAGSTDTSSKIYLIGATTQAANPQTYSNSKLYYTRSSGLYSEGGNDDNFSIISQSGRKIDLSVSTDNTSHTPKVTVDETGVYIGDTTVSSSTITLNSGLWWSDSDNYVRIKNLIAPTNNTDAATKKYVDDSIPTNISSFTNDAGYITSADVPEGASAYTGTISAVSTTASNGTSNGFARGDHVHNITSSTITSALGYTPGTSNLAIGTTATTAAAGNHTHTTSLTTSTGTSTVSLSANSKYQITAGGTSVIFTTPSDSDTKNTAGSTNTSSKIFLIGATSQAANPQTYSHDTAYVGTDGKLYSASKAVLVGGSNASSSVTITPTTTDVYSMTSAGSVTAGTKASFTRGTFSQGTLPTMTWAMDSTDTKKLNITFSQGTLPTHAADSFTANTPTAVTLPGRSGAIKAWTGYSAATADAQTFTGVTA